MGASSLEDSMQEGVLGSQRMGMEHLLGVPMPLEVLKGVESGYSVGQVQALG